MTPLLDVFLVGLVVAAAALILLTSHVLYAALGLLCVLLGMSAIYFLQGAAFVAVAHVIVYGSSILVLILFSTLLLPLASKSTYQRPKWVLGSLVTGLLGGCLWPLVRFTACTLQQRSNVHPLQADAVAGLGMQLLGPYAFAFEWIGLAFLIALVGVVHIMEK